MDILASASGQLQMCVWGGGGGCTRICIAASGVGVRAVAELAQPACCMRQLCPLPQLSCISSPPSTPAGGTQGPLSPPLTPAGVPSTPTAVPWRWTQRAVPWPSGPTPRPASYSWGSTSNAWPTARGHWRCSVRGRRGGWGCGGAGRSGGKKAGWVRGGQEARHKHLFEGQGGRGGLLQMGKEAAACRSPRRDLPLGGHASHLLGFAHL